MIKGSYSMKEDKRLNLFVWLGRQLVGKKYIVGLQILEGSLTGQRIVIATGTDLKKNPKYFAQLVPAFCKCWLQVAVKVNSISRFKKE